MSWQKRSLSESSTGSEAEDWASNGFKRPRLSSSSSFAPNFERRESQASTASSTSFSVSESEDADVQRLNHALDSNSNSETEDETGNARPSFGGSFTNSPANPMESMNYSSVSQKLMAKMGYQAGKGLGKAGQGRVEPVQASSQRGRRGLGHILKGLEDEKVDWDPDQEVVEAREQVDWLPINREEVPSMSELRSWMSEGPRKETIDDEDSFCDIEILKGILSGKAVFDQLENREMCKARTRSNPWEIIHGVFFLNRAAMKMANMDAAFDFMFTNPSKKSVLKIEIS